MLSQVQRTIREHRLLDRGDLVLVAVSGGPDSMALLHALWELRERLGVTLEVATVDHGLRPEARAEADRVAERARDLGLAFHLVAVDVRAARGVGASLQDAARRARLGALDELAARLGAARIALGHQADDQVETVLFRILRGTGVRGLRGIPYRRDRFIRPLLDLPRRQVLAYLRRRSIPFCDDPSNADPRFARARLRHRLLPALREENPRVGEALRALAADAARIGAPPPDADVAALPIGRRAASAVRRLRRDRGGTTLIDVAGGAVEISYGKVAFRRRAAPQPEPEPPMPVTVARPGDYGWGGGVLVAVREVGSPDAIAAAVETGAVSFDADALARPLHWPLQLRPLRPGDRMKPRGGRGSRKISDLLIDAKIARARRARLPALTSADGAILYVPGLRPSELGRPSSTTRRWLSVRAGERAGDPAGEAGTE
jgi:tRNA(Ile)-lysidine synthase